MVPFPIYLLLSAMMTDESSVISDELHQGILAPHYISRTNVFLVGIVQGVHVQYRYIQGCSERYEILRIRVMESHTDD
jgi:hypothetical protein